MQCEWSQRRQAQDGDGDGGCTSSSAKLSRHRPLTQADNLIELLPETVSRLMLMWQLNRKPFISHVKWEVLRLIDCQRYDDKENTNDTNDIVSDSRCQWWQRLNIGNHDNDKSIKTHTKKKRERNEATLNICINFGSAISQRRREEKVESGK